MELKVVNALGVQLMHAGNDEGTLGGWMQQLKKQEKTKKTNMYLQAKTS